MTIALFFAIDSFFPVTRSTLVKQAIDPETKDETFFKSFDVEIEEKSKVTTTPEQIVSEVQLVKKDSGETVHSATYVMDRLWRRLPVVKTNSDTAVVYLGCSFVFGENINNDETLPSYAEEMLPGVQHINLGLPSLGLNDIYAQLAENYRLPHMKDSFDPRERYLDLPAKKIILVYYFIGDHLFRSQCSQRCFDQDEVLVRSKPFFEVNENHLIYKGSQREHLSVFSRILSSSNILRNSGIEIPSPLSEENLQRHFLFLKKIKEVYSSKYEVLGAYTFYNPLETRALIDKVEQHNTFHDFEPITLDKTSLLKEYGVEKLLLHYDGHPSPLLNKISANAVSQKLKKQHFSLEK